MTTPADVEPTALDLVLESVRKICVLTDKAIRPSGTSIGSSEMREALLDLQASYFTYLYVQQTHGECAECGYPYDDPDEGCDACIDKKVTS